MAAWEQTCCAVSIRAGLCSSCVRSISAVVIVLSRTGSAVVQCEFHDELSAVLDSVATYQDPIYIAGDVKILLERPDDPHIY